MNEEYLYGFRANQELKGACCDWDTFAWSFVENWKNERLQMPERKIILKARRLWTKYHMTGYEAFITFKKYNFGED